MNAFAGVFDPGDRGNQGALLASALAPEPCGYLAARGPFTIAAVASESGPVSCAFAGYLTNLPEIRTRSRVAESVPPCVAIPELVRREGLAAISALRGAFVVAVWDYESAGGVIATDHLGAGGLFYLGDGRRLSFGSEIRIVLGLLKQTPGPDEDALIRWLANDSAGAGQTLYEGVRRLRGGELIELAADSFCVRTYWHPTYSHPVAATVVEHAENVRLAASAAVVGRLSPGQTTGILLSGGLDSSTIAAFASRSEAAELHAYSAVFPDHPEMDESDLIELVARSMGLPVTKIVVVGGSMLAPALDYLATWRLPSVSPNLLFMTPLARAAADAGVPVLLDGEGGDELFTSSPYVFADLLTHGRVPQALALANQLQGITEAPRAKALRWILREWVLKGGVPYTAHAMARQLRSDHYGAAWLTPEAAARHGRHADRWEWKRLDGPRWWASLAYDFTEGRQRFGAHDFLRHKSASAGLQGRHPYMEDLELVERMLSIPSEASFDPTYDRPLLRRAIAGQLPDEVRLRPDKSYFNSLFDQALTSTDRDALMRLFDRRARVAAHVRLDEVRNYVLGAAARPAAWAWIVWRIAAAECWLRSLEDPAFPGKVLSGWGLEASRFEFLPAMR